MKNKTRRRPFLLGCVLGSAALFGSQGHAEERLEQDLVPPTRVAKLQERRPNEFGTSSDTILSISSSAFVARFPYDHLYQGSDGRSYFVTDDSIVFDAVAPVTLPAGVIIDTIEFVGCAVNQGDWDIYLFVDHGAGSSSDTIAAFTTTAGCGYQVLDLSYASAGNLDNYYRFLLHQSPSAPIPDDSFRAVNVWYHRTVSPPPASATFNDVLPGDPLFQYVEALAASGITAGCGGGNYCPSSLLTRGQMAVFLAKALGLHWPN